MARDAIPVTTLTANTAIEPPAGVTGVAANDLKITPANADDIILVEVQNNHATLDRVVTFVTSTTVFGVPVEDVSVTITALERRLFKLTNLIGLWKQTDGDIYINVADDTDLKFWAYKL